MRTASIHSGARRRYGILGTAIVVGTRGRTPVRVGVFVDVCVGVEDARAVRPLERPGPTRYLFRLGPIKGWTGWTASSNKNKRNSNLRQNAFSGLSSRPHTHGGVVIGLNAGEQNRCVQESRGARGVSRRVLCGRGHVEESISRLTHSPEACRPRCQRDASVEATAANK